MITYVEDRCFNDLRYTINCSKLHALGWKELCPFPDGLEVTVKWFMKNSGRFGNLENALVAHPRAGLITN